jgi:hypothetical protein
MGWYVLGSILGLVTSAAVVAVSSPLGLRFEGRSWSLRLIALTLGPLVVLILGALALTGASLVA